MKKSLLFRKRGHSFCKVCLWVYLLFGATSLYAQDVASKKVTLDLKDSPIINVLLEIQKQTGVNFAYEKSQLEKFKLVTVSVKQIPVEEVLKTILKDSGFTYKITGNNIAIVRGEEKAEVNLMTVKGKVVDEKGNPLIGATVVISGTTQGVATDVDGKFSLAVRPNDVLVFSFIGYKDESVLVKGKSNISVRMNPSAENLEEVAVVAFGEQKKESVVSAITTVRPMDLKTSNSDLTASFAGKIAGIVGWQTGGLPGALTEDEMNTKFYIRGITSFQSGANIDPLILLDGVEVSKVDLARIAPEDIETFSVMKDASATAMYGARGANGVILVTTKKGEEGNVYASVRYEAIASMPTKKIDVVDPVTYMRMYNQALLSRDPLATPAYSEERIMRTESKRYPSWVYPANDWYDILFKPYNVNHHFGLNIRGGSRVMQYYTSVNYNLDYGMMKTDRLNDFSVNIRNATTTLRSNLNIDLAAGIRLLVNFYVSLDDNHGPIINSSNAYSLAFKASPVDFAPTYPADENYDWEHIRFGGTAGDRTNPYMMLQKGYMDRYRYSALGKVEYIHNLSSLLKGLELRASASLSKSSLSLKSFSVGPMMYALEKYDEETGKHTLTALNASGSDNSLRLGTANETGKTQMAYELRALHTAAWGDHQTSLTAVLNAMETTEMPVSTVIDGLKHRNLGFSMRGTYGFKDRYFVEGSFGFNGSERFAKKHRMGLFPAVGGAWVVSKENFMQGISNVLPFLKFRASWGKVGNDGIIDKPRFVYIEEINQIEIPSLKPGKNRENRYSVSNYGNEDIEWEIAEQVNLGLETKWFDGILEFTLDAYQEIRHNVLSFRTVVPAAVGLDALQMDNIGKVKSRGIDFSGKIQHAFTPDFWVILNGTFTYNKAKYMELEEAADRPEWQRKVGHEISQQVGYIAEGLFRDQAEIDNAPVQGGDLMPGDIRYRDINGDGKIDVNDAVHIGYPETPRVTYGFSGIVNYKNWEFAFSFQGSGKRSFFMNPMEISPFAGNNAMLTAIYKDHWSTDNMSNKPFWPRLSTASIEKHNPQEDWYADIRDIRKSTYFMRQCRFLRCTSIELAYNLPDKLKGKLKMKNVKFFARANNPFLISNFKVWDVELGEGGFNYPIQKTYSLGLNFSF